MIDSTEADKMESGLKTAGGKCIINSTNYEDGDDRFNQVLNLALNYGSGIVIGTIDENGMARTSEQKFSIAKRALQKTRARKLAEPLVVKSWNDVQKNIGKFNNYFKGNFIIIDNNDAKEDVFTEVFKRVRSLANRKIQNKRAQQWIDNELKMRNITKFKRKVV